MVGTAWALEGGTHCTEREAAAAGERPSDERRASEGRREGRERLTDRERERGQEEEEEEGQEEMLTAS